MVRYARQLCLLALIPLLANASEYPQKTLQADSIICFDSDDWAEMIAASVDEDEAAMQRLISKGACRHVTQSTQVSYLDPAAGGGALIQLRSGKTAYTADAFLSN